MSDPLIASSEEIRRQLKELDAKRRRLMRLLRIAEEDEGKAGARPAARPDGPAGAEAPAGGSADGTDAAAFGLDAGAEDLATAEVPAARPSLKR